MSGVAILNGFGRVLGDHLIGFQSLYAALELGAVTGPIAFGLPDLGPVIDDLRAAADFCPTRELPWADATRDHPFPGAAAFTRIVDCRDLAFDPDYLAHHDLGRYFLRRLGLEPEAVPPALRRITWLRPRIPPVASAGYILICPRSAMPLRSMPDAFHALACRVAAGFAPILSQADLPPAPSLVALCALVAAARLVLSTDTAMVHLADALDIPCLAFFPTHDPALRVASYPRCLPVRLASSLPPNLEFPRSDADIATAHAAWPSRDAAGLAALIAEALARNSSL